MEMIMGVGFILSLREKDRATGATINTVDTLSIKADIAPAKRAREMITHFILGILSIRISLK